MPNQITKRDVQVVLDKLADTIKAANNLQTIQPERSMAIAITHLQTGELWLGELMAKSPERLG